MDIAIMVIGISLIVMSVFLVVAVLMQSSKDHRLGASIAGGAETFFGKQKGKSMDAMFNKLTTVIAIVFVVLVLVLFFIAPSSTVVPGADGGNATDNNLIDEGDATGNNIDDLIEENGTDATDSADVVDGADVVDDTNADNGADVAGDTNAVDTADVADNQ